MMKELTNKYKKSESYEERILHCPHLRSKDQRKNRATNYMVKKSHALTLQLPLVWKAAKAQNAGPRYIRG